MAKKQADLNNLEELKQRLLDGLKAYPKGLSRTHLVTKVFGNNIKADVLDRVLAALEHDGIVRVKQITRAHTVRYNMTLITLLIPPGPTSTPSR